MKQNKLTISFITNRSLIEKSLTYHSATKGVRTAVALNLTPYFL